MKFKNNSEQMKTEVETFVIEETASLIYDNDELERWNSLVSELGLEGQKEIVKPDKSPIPFMHLKSNMVAVFDTLCPVRVAVENYSLTPIPTEILELVMLSKREGYFQKMEIWYDDKSPDPVCVGMNTTYYVYFKTDTGRGKKQDNLTKADYEHLKEDPDYDWGSSNSPVIYLIGKWADVKHSFEELIQMAKNRWEKTQRTSHEQTIKQYQGYLNDLEQESNKKFDY